MATTHCPCGSGRPFAECCGPFLEGGALPQTAEALMRSRYTAFALGAPDYLRSSWHSNTCPRDVLPNPTTKWTGLKIVATEAGGPNDIEGEVEFVARYKIQGRAHRLHERSRFVRENGEWRYLDGVLDPD
ncbi:hypothetical protein G3480_17860 [Thiorhodococcus mannitoliphagus]|uniref:UPF0225 protein G3480_17860 n=1 Tax=Thiorhodococcus mannitoliphagus TaxID=329406 RepID=A0A6P1DVK0_9GAMM|nr:YchJ family metal-binding protein [Thiorhodococcus mannitoliphagus]NEX22148.1 hypothetical protein [Thiorhodococcus mannitoliphagus]